MRDSTAFYLFVLFCCLLAAVIYSYYKPYQLVEERSPNGEAMASLFVEETELGQYPTVFIKVVDTQGGNPAFQPLDHPPINIWFGRGDLDYEIKWENNERLIVTNLKDPRKVWSVGVKPLLSVTHILPDKKTPK